jgi:hypothetical protein
LYTLYGIVTSDCGGSVLYFGRHHGSTKTVSGLGGVAYDKISSFAEAPKRLSSPFFVIWHDAAAREKPH